MTTAGIRFEFSFASSPADDDGHAWGLGLVWVGESLLWQTEYDDGSGAPVAWTWVDLLEHLTNSWAAINYEELYPFGLTPSTPNFLRLEAEQRWQDATKAQRLVEDEALFFFEERHNLARGMRGISLPGIFLMREGNQMWVASGDLLIQRPFVNVTHALEEAGSQIAMQLSCSAHPRARAAVDAWRARARVPTFFVLRSGLSQAEVEHLRGTRSAEEFWELSAGNDDSELLAAARMIGGKMPRSEMARILDVVRQQPHTHSGELDSLSEKAGPLVDVNEHPYQDGYSLGVWLRTQLSLGSAKVDPIALLRRWNVNIIEMNLERTRIEALACWGPKHGPSVILNLVDIDGEPLSPDRIRATLAHEICHLLVDRETSLPLAEVLRGIAPRRPEQRARAFAAQLLLPKLEASAEVRRATSIVDAIEALRSRFGVSAVLAAWQILNSPDLPQLADDELEYLKAVAAERKR